MTNICRIRYQHAVMLRGAAKAYYSPLSIYKSVVTTNSVADSPVAGGHPPFTSGLTI